MKEINESLGQLIKDYRGKKGFTQLELSQQLGYDTPQFVSILERGMAKVPLNVIGQLIVILGIPEKKIMKLLTSAFQTELKTQISLGKSKAVAG